MYPYIIIVGLIAISLSGFSSQGQRFSLMDRKAIPLAFASFLIILKLASLYLLRAGHSDIDVLKLYFLPPIAGILFLIYVAIVFSKSRKR